MAASNPARSGMFYGWFVVATCMFIAFLTMGTRNAFGAFVVPMEAEFEWNRTVVSWAAALGALLNGVTQPFMGYLFDRVGVRIVVIAGIAVVGASTLLMAATGSIWFLIAVFGVVSAIGQSGTSLTNTGATLSKWFRRRRGLVIGLNASGMSLGGLILVPFAAYLISLIDWRLSWIVLGLMILCLGIPLAFHVPARRPGQEGPDPRRRPGTCARTRRFSRRSQRAAAATTVCRKLAAGVQVVPHLADELLVLHLRVHYLHAVGSLRAHGRGGGHQSADGSVDLRADVGPERAGRHRSRLDLRPHRGAQELAGGGLFLPGHRLRHPGGCPCWSPRFR